MKTHTISDFLKLTKFCLVLLLLLGITQAHAQKKIVGYIPTGFGTSSVDFTRITHLMLAFENPDAAGNLSWAAGNDAFVTTAHNNNVKVPVSICGGGASNDATYQTRYTTLMNSTNRAGFISKISTYLTNHNLDGIDLDLEGPAINGNYNDFVVALKNALPSKLVTCALSHTNGGDLVSNTAAQTFDFIGVMAYDNGWGTATHHSTYQFAQTSAAWWVTNKGVAASKVILGVPFYGYTGTTGAGDITFGQIVSTYGASAAQADTWTANSGGTIYYNGIPTIRQKSQLVVDQGYGGIMIWQLAQDATGSNALLPNIKQVLDGACALPTQPGAITGNTSVTSGSSNTYSVPSVAGVTYAWTLPSGWSGSSTTNSITATAGSSGTISVVATNSCGSSTARTLAVTVTCSVPAQPGAMSGNTSIASGSSNTYSVTAVAGVSYAWTLPSGWSGSSTTNSITATAGSSGTISVVATNSCGSSTARTLVVSVGCTLPAQPSTITGNASVASGSSNTYSVTAVGGVSYAWTLPSGWSGSSTTNSITATAGSSGTISVVATNSCGSSTARTLAVTVGTPSSNLALNRPTTVSSVEPTTSFVGANAVDGSGTTRWASDYIDASWIYVDLGASYSVNRVKITWEAAYGTAYRVQISANASTWSDMKVVTGNTTLINDHTGLTGTGRYVRMLGTTRSSQWGYSIYEFEVYGTSGCTLPAQPSTISGNTSVTSGSTNTYSVTAVAGVSYAWTLPSGWSGSSTTNSITATAGSSGTISVVATNSCGSSTARTLAVTVGCTLPAQPSAISGNTTVASGSSNTYSVAAVSGVSYAWTLPSGWSGSSTTNSITATAGSSGTISVVATNSCGSSTARTLAVTVGSSSTNRALGRPVTVTSVEPGTTFGGANAVDGNATTRWSSGYSDPQSIIVDLGAQYAVNRVKITWEAAYGVDYKVQISTDGTVWNDMKVVTNNATLVNDHTGLTGTGRYVAMYGTRRSSQWGFSIFELEVYGNPTGGRLAGGNLFEESEADEDDGLSVYPSPAETTLFIRSGKSYIGGHVKIINMSGEEFISGRVERDEIDVTALPSGLYVLRLSKDQQLAVKKFIKK
jgi:hypothetical protein